MKNIKSFCIGAEGASGIICEDKDEFLRYISEEIDRINEEGKYEHFDIMLYPNND